MKDLTDQQKKLLWLHMNAAEGDTFERHAQWATRQFNKHITAEECSTYYMERLIG